MRPLVFLGGTCNGSTWRCELIPQLEKENIPYFNPVVKNWTVEDQNKEREIKMMPNVVGLYVLTSAMTGSFSVAEAVDSSNKRPASTVFYYRPMGFTTGQMKSLEAISEMLRDNGAHVVKNFDSVVGCLKRVTETWDSVNKRFGK